MEELFNKAMEFLGSAQGASMTIAIVMEFVFRLVPSKKPLSILHMIAKGAGLVGKVLVKFAEVADSILPQKIKGE
jgi:hypothetical protein